MSDVILHEAHVRVFRCRNAAPWLAGRSARFMMGYLEDVQHDRGEWERDCLKMYLDAVLASKRMEFRSRMNEVRKAVFG